MQVHLPQSYPVVLMDPPWSYYGQQDKWGAAAKHYSTMDDRALLGLPMYRWLGKPGVLFMWATGPRLDFAIECVKRWGLYYRGVAFVWVKTKQDGTPIGAKGVRPSIVKPLTEFVLAASTEATGRPLPLASESVVQTILAPVTEHSRKPVEVFERIDMLYPGQSKLEMFARGPGYNSQWDVWGDQAEDESPSGEVGESGT